MRTRSHYTLSPDPGIKYVLHGWADDEKPARIDLQYKDVRVRNVPTNIRTFDGGTERHGNSIFIFEVANLCIAHLGHLHHTLTQQQLNEIGRVDIVLVPVDGSYTLDLDGMVEVLHALKAPLMIPMHYFSAYTLDRFLQRVRQEWDVEVAEIPSLVVSQDDPPGKAEGSGAARPLTAAVNRASKCKYVGLLGRQIAAVIAGLSTAAPVDLRGTNRLVVAFLVRDFERFRGIFHGSDLE